MSKTTKHKQGKSRRVSRGVAAQNAAARKEERAAAQAKLAERHAKRRAAIAQYERAFAVWADAEEGLRREAEERGEFTYDLSSIGPCPLDPRFHDRALFPENFQPV